MTRDDLNADELEVLESVEWAEDEFGSMTRGGYSDKLLDHMIYRGLIRSVGDVDEHSDPGVLTGRRVEGFVLTERGREALR